jgi:Protein of unknown function (DUF1565)/Divergent InlB B-repeat domain
VDSLPAFRDHLHVRTLALAWLLVACSSQSGAVDAPLVVVADAPRAVDAVVPDAPDALVIGDSGGPPADAGPDAGQTFTLTIVFQGSGAGQVKVVESAQTCTSECALPFAPGSQLTLQATVGPGSIFMGWGGACSGSADCAVTLDADATVQASFNASDATATLNILVSGPGTVGITPSGSSCGPGCTQFDRGTPVTVMPVPNGGFSFISWNGDGPCESAPASCTFTLDNDTNLTAQFCQFQHVVSVTGDDTHTGTCVAPYRTVGKALSVAQSGDAILAESGQYDGASGETFPLALPDGVRLVGDGITQTGFPNTHISGSGSDVIALGAGATIEQLFIDHPGSVAGDCVLAAQGGSIRADIITNCVNGVDVTGGSGLVVSGSLLVGNQTGLAVAAAASGIRVEQTIVADNQSGIVTLAAIDLGGGTTGSLGGNTIACNSGVDLTATGDFVISATNSFWDGGATPSRGCGAGNDICLSGGATIVLDGAQSATCP